MQLIKFGTFLVLGIAAQACGGDSDDGGGGGDGDTGGSTSSGGSSSGGSSSGGSSSGGSSSGGSSSGGSSSGGSSSGGSSSGGSSSGGSSSGGTSGTGGCTAGQTNLFESAECEPFFECVYESACAMAGAQQQVCIDILRQAFETSYPACVPNADVTTACDMIKSDAGSMYPECVD